LDESSPVPAAVKFNPVNVTVALLGLLNTISRTGTFVTPGITEEGDIAIVPAVMTNVVAVEVAVAVAGSVPVGLMVMVGVAVGVFVGSGVFVVVGVDVNVEDGTTVLVHMLVDVGIGDRVIVAVATVV